MNVRIYLRRSKNDEGKQQFSLDVQRKGCCDFIEGLGLTMQDDFIEYLDDGKAGDDFHTREGIRRLLAEARPGDIIVCRDQSRLGREAVEVIIVIRHLIRDYGCRLFYYATGQEVQFANAMDQVATPATPGVWLSHHQGMETCLFRAPARARAMLSITSAPGSRPRWSRPRLRPWMTRLSSARPTSRAWWNRALP